MLIRYFDNARTAVTDNNLCRVEFINILDDELIK